MLKYVLFGTVQGWNGLLALAPYSVLNQKSLQPDIMVLG